MGVSSQQHRVSTGLFNNIGTVCPVRCHVSFTTCLFSIMFNSKSLMSMGLILYFYILSYLMFFSVDLDCAIAPRPLTSHSPNFYGNEQVRTYLNQWFLVI